MRGLLWVPREQRLTRGVTLAAVVTAGLVASASSQTTTTQPKTATTAPEVLADATVESLFTDFLHYARLGQFTAGLPILGMARMIRGQRADCPGLSNAFTNNGIEYSPPSTR